MTAPSTPQNVSLHLRDLRGKPHAEVVIIKRDTEGLGAVGICYNTLSLPDRLSDEQFRALNADALKAEFGGDGIWMNGPRRAQMDEASAEVLDGGQVTSVGGIPMQTVAKVRIPDVRMFAGRRPAYIETEVERSTTWVFHAGQPVHELAAPDGGVYAMQSASLIKDPNLAEQLPNLGERLHMPDGWTYRVRTPDHDLVVQARDGVAHVVLDEFENNYQRED
jgi:hypothetical protein